MTTKEMSPQLKPQPTSESIDNIFDENIVNGPGLLIERVSVIFFGTLLSAFFLLQLGHVLPNISHTFSLVSNESAKTLLEFGGIALIPATITTALIAKGRALNNKETPLLVPLNDQGYREL